MLLTSAFDTDI